MNPKFIIIDGKRYRSVDEMPPEVRQKYEQAMRAMEDRNGNQIPDILENMAADKTAVNTKIIVDGKEFNSIDEMPPDVRQKYEQAMQPLRDLNTNNIPDAFETTSLFADKNQSSISDMLENLAADGVKVIVKKMELKGGENLSPEQRAKLEEVMNRLDANRNGIPDFAEGIPNAPNQVVNISTKVEMPASTSFDLNPSATASMDTDLPAIPTTEVDTANGWQLVLAGLLVVLLCGAGAAGVWYFYLR